MLPATAVASVSPRLKSASFCGKKFLITVEDARKLGKEMCAEVLNSAEYDIAGRIQADCAQAFAEAEDKVFLEGAGDGGYIVSKEMDEEIKKRLIVDFTLIRHPDLPTIKFKW